MIPLTLADKDKEQIIKKIGGTEEVRHHLANLGFAVGGTVTVINSLNGNLILKVKESRVAIDENLARKIMV
ncbi:MAG: ferrous iron transport protein A [Treponema sp.]|jgi:ferrous iron transport protein A|nr:ferrous iron transport protein A [Treponema sp.]